MTPKSIASAICALALIAVPIVAADDQTGATLRVPTGAAVFIENTEFGQALSAAVLKKKVPVVVVTDREKADYFVTEVSKASKEGAAERVAKVLVFGMFAGTGKTFEASVNCTNRDGIVVFARNTSKPSIKKAAEDIASKLRDHITKQ
jgi:ATP phosphoribosyltransferase